ncbi:MAG TPA: twin-arginine translocase subunit TatC [Candidatus Limnocylindrales bacterium]|nr:twin-arginine translocase subunit TatC [Candidatus Limnocylindrales bacterium]
MTNADLVGGATPAQAIDPDQPQGSSSPGSDETVMTLVDHLAELRNRLIKSIVAVVVGSLVGWIATPELMKVLRGPIGDRTLIFLSPGEAFFVYIKIAAAVGIILAMPVILYQVWAFVAPGLTTEERRVVRPWIPLALLLFVVGVVIAYVVLPFAMAFLLGFEIPDVNRAELTMNNYFGFVTTLFLAFGLMMEFPILLFGLSRVGIVTSERLRTVRRYVIVGIAVFSTVVTPGGDIVSPTVLGLTMYVLFELSIWFIRRSGR